MDGIRQLLTDGAGKGKDVVSHAVRLFQFRDGLPLRQGDKHGRVDAAGEQQPLTKGGKGLAEGCEAFLLA